MSDVTKSSPGHRSRPVRWNPVPDAVTTDHARIRLSEGGEFPVRDVAAGARRSAVRWSPPPEPSPLAPARVPSDSGHTVVAGRFPLALKGLGIS
jgi:hypothetical protein